MIIEKQKELKEKKSGKSNKSQQQEHKNKRIKECKIVWKWYVFLASFEEIVGLGIPLVYYCFRMQGQLQFLSLYFFKQKCIVFPQKTRVQIFYNYF